MVRQMPCESVGGACMPPSRGFPAYPLIRGPSQMRCFRRDGRSAQPQSDRQPKIGNLFWGRSGEIRQGKSEVTPSIETPEEGTDTRDAAAGEVQRRTGAAGFVGSGAIENDIAIARDLLVP
jgi:hypothetical protein